jgi:hypothetical protein
MATDGDTGSFQPLASRALTPGAYYRFTVLASGELGSSKVIAALEAKGWNVKGIEGALPGSVSRIAIPATPVPWAVTPSAFTVHAYWQGAPTTLPLVDGTTLYGPLEVWVQAGTSWTPWVVGAAAAAGVWFLWSTGAFRSY